MDQVEQELLKANQKRISSDALLSGKYSFFETLKNEITHKCMKQKALKENDAYHQSGYIKKLLINVGHMESQTAMLTFRQIPNAKMQKVYKYKDENTLNDNFLRHKLG